MKTIQFVRAYSGDWSGIYIDRMLYYENHSIPDHVWLELFEKFGVGFEEVYDWHGEEYGNLPQNYDLVAKERFSKE